MMIFTGQSLIPCKNEIASWLLRILILVYNHLQTIFIAKAERITLTNPRLT